MEKEIGFLADGFSIIEKENVFVEFVKMSTNIHEILKKHDYNTHLWGAEIIVDNSLKNPVIIGKNKIKAVFKKSTWCLINGKRKCNRK